MKKFNHSFTGGHRFKTTDLTFGHECFSEAISAFSTAFVDTDEYVILSGCERSIAGGMTTISNGYVFFGGEICFHPSTTYTTAIAGDYEYWDNYVDTLPTGTRVYFDDLTHETHEVRYARVTKATSLPGGSQLYSDTLSIHDKIKQNIPLDSWQVFITTTIPPGGFFPGTYTLQCRKTIEGFVQISGTMQFEDIGEGAIDHIIATLPAGYRPTTLITLPVSGIFNAGTGEVGVNIVTIDTLGVMRFRSNSMGYAWVSDFGQLNSFPTV